MTATLGSPAPAAPVPATTVAGRLGAQRARDRRRSRLVAGALVAGLLGLGVAALGLGAVPLAPSDVVAGLVGADGGPRFIVAGLRLPRLALGLLVGAALGLAGALLQGVVRNPLASPDIVGLTGGASAAAVLAIAGGATGAEVDVAALAGALVAAAAVFGLSGGTSGTRFVVVGVAVAFLASGVLGYALTRASLTEAQSAFFWLVGSVGTAPWGDVARLAVVLGVVGAGLLWLRRPLTALALDDDTARSIGARPRRTRVVAIALSTVLAAVAVAVAGPIAFVAFVSGPLGRRLRGRGPALGTSAAVGALVVVAADLLAQHAIPGSLQPPAGLVTGALGAPVLLWLLVRGEQRKETRA